MGHGFFPGINTGKIPLTFIVIALSFVSPKGTGNSGKKKSTTKAPLVTTPKTKHTLARHSIIGSKVFGKTASTTRSGYHLLGETHRMKVGGQVEVQWLKGDADAIRIESDKGTGWQFLAVNSVPHYTDTTAITAPATWKYRAMYLVSDELVGQWSDVASIAVS